MKVKSNPKKTNKSKKNDIVIPKQDIKVESGQPTFLKALTKIVKKKK